MTHLISSKLVKHILFTIFCASILISCAAKTMPDKNSSSQGLMAPEDRYLIHDTGIVLDKKTSLEWYASDTPRLQEPATRYSLSLIKKDDAAWRLPTRSELYDLYKNGRKHSKPLKMNRDIFWIKNYHVYDLFSNTVSYSPSIGLRFSIVSARYGYDVHDGDNYDQASAYLLVVRSREQEI